MPYRDYLLKHLPPRLGLLDLGPTPRLSRPLALVEMRSGPGRLGRLMRRPFRWLLLHQSQLGTRIRPFQYL